MIDVVMPQMGESIVEGTLTKWLKKPGERVERDEPLFEISTDKVDTEIPSPAAGVLQDVLVEEGTDGRHQHGGRANRMRAAADQRRRQLLRPPQAIGSAAGRTATSAAAQQNSNVPSSGTCCAGASSAGARASAGAGGGQPRQKSRQDHFRRWFAR